MVRFGFLFATGTGGGFVRTQRTPPPYGPAHTRTHTDCVLNASPGCVLTAWRFCRASLGQLVADLGDTQEALGQQGLAYGSKTVTITQNKVCDILTPLHMILV